MTVITAVLIAGLLSPATRDSLLAETHGNREVWEDAFLTFSGEELLCVEYLFKSIPRLDRLEMTGEALLDHVRGALSTRNRYYQEGTLPDSLFLSCILFFRVDQEPVTGYRHELGRYWNRELTPRTSDVLQTASRVAETVHTMLEPAEQGYLGGIEPPLVVLSSSAATPAESTVLFCASLKSLGIAARQITGWFHGEDGGRRRWVEVWVPEGRWEPLALPWEPVPDGFRGLALAVSETTGEAVTRHYAETGQIRIHSGDEPPEEEWMGTVSIPVRSGYIPLDWAWFTPGTEDSLELGPGSYLICTGRRNADGSVTMLTETVILEPGGDRAYRPGY
jgi:hypothetical protein